MKKLYTQSSIGSNTHLKTLIVLTFIMLGKTILAQDFTWMRGSPFSGTIASVYGTQGVSSPLNDPSTRHGANTWVDTNGDLWLFGGEGPDLQWHSDLWKYTVSTNEWTFMTGNTTPNQPSVYGTMGVSSPTNNPGSREFSFSWVDQQGKFWLFGGDGYASITPQTYAAALADLWKYDPVTNEWTFVKGTTTLTTAGVYGTMGVAAPNNMPGGRRASATWVDANGNLWMFGGHGYDNSNSLLVYLNDLWKFDISTSQWTWMGGSSTGNQNAVNGTMGVPASTNRPGAVEFPSAWVSNGKFYLFGGKGYCSLTTVGRLQDMWCYDLTTGLWTWVAGSNLTNQVGHYGTLGVAGATVLPGGREAAACWSDPSGDLWIFGGDGYSATSIGLVNDLFKFNTSTNQFTWMKGSNVTFMDGTYGTMGLSSPSAIPGARTYNTFWNTTNGSSWIFGGNGIDSLITTVKNNMQDLWRFSVPCQMDSLAAAPQGSICSGKTANLLAFNRINSPVNWYLTPTSGSSVGTGTALTTANLSAGTTPSVYTYYAEVTTCSLQPRSSINITVNPTPTLSISGPTALCIGETGTLTGSGALNYTWTGGQVANTFTINPQTLSNYVVQGSNVYNCKATASVDVAINPSPTLVVSGSTAICISTTGTLIASGASTYSWSGGYVGSTYTINPQTNSNYTLQGINVFNCIGTKTISIPVFPNPTLTLLTTSAVVCKGNSATLTASGATTYSWNVNSLSGSTMVVSPTVTTVYQVTGTDANNCSAKKTVTISLCNLTSIASNDFRITGFKLFPNPAKEKFVVELSELPAGELHFVIYNQLGQIVSTQKIEQLINSVELQQASGIYFYRLSSNDFNYASGKLVVE